MVSLRHRADIYGEIWPGTLGVKWPINLHPDGWRPLSAAAVILAQLHLRSRALFFSREVIRSSLHPPICVSIRTGPAEDDQSVMGCWVQRLVLSLEFSTSSPESTKVFSFNCRVEKHRSILVVRHQSRGPGGEALYAGRVPLSDWSMFIHNFSPLWHLQQPVSVLYNSLAKPPGRRVNESRVKSKVKLHLNGKKVVTHWFRQTRPQWWHMEAEMSQHKVRMRQ